MALTLAGAEFLAQAAVGQGVPFNNANAYLGVGNAPDSVAGTSPAYTDLMGGSKVRKPMDTGYPVVNGPTITFKSTFPPSDANFAWNEWGIFNAASGGVMLSRVSESNGTKQDNQTWVLEVSITFSIGN